MPELGEIGGEVSVGEGLAVDEDSVVVENHEVIAHEPDPKRRKPPCRMARGLPIQELFGGVLLSHRVPPAVPSAL
ncbi:hypothetical protein GCM10018777_49660 [Streptomyces albogriseolus]|nr:hypothetical protein GCM10018777_49660 [Streptomyces viridodiastaticus]